MGAAGIMASIKYISKISLVVFSAMISAGTSVSHAQIGAGVYDEPQSERVMPPLNGEAFADINLLDALEKGRVGNVRFEDADGIRAFYEARNYKFAWVNNSWLGQLATNQENSEAILGVLQSAWQHGLNPDEYHVQEIRDVIGQDTLPFNAGNSPTLELLFTDAISRYVKDLSAMRVNARDIGLHPRYWKEPASADVLLTQVKNSKDVVKAMNSFAPQGKLYRMLQEELVSLYNTPQTAQNQKVSLTRGVLRPGQSRDAVFKLRARMGFEVDKSNAEHRRYDDALAQSVMSFQKAHGLEPDGIVGPYTLKIMNKDNGDRINQILVNMERLRWLERDKPERYVIVNVPAAHLWAIENGDIAFDMKVVVGRKKRATNIFNTEITGVRLNPTWTVPPTIKKEDFLPELQNDPLYLTNKGIEIIKAGQTIDPTTVDWTMVDENQLHGVQMVQQPGRSNPLGQVRVFMSNPYNIYLHDTNTPRYFERSNRALSSGCIRMEDSIRMANFILEGKDGWSPEKTQSILNRGRKTDIAIDQRIPVYIIYQTIWLGEQGQLVYGYDIYGRDAVLRRALHDIKGVGFPKTMKASEPELPKISRAKVIKKTKKVIKKTEEQQADNSPRSLINNNNQSLRSVVTNVGNMKKNEDSVDLLTFNE